MDLEESQVVIDEAYVDKALSEIVVNQDVSQFIL